MSSILKSESAVVSASDDVVNGRHPENDELCERHPATDYRRGQGYQLRGNKRYVPGEISSPSKRRRDLHTLEDHFQTQIENPVCESRTGRGNNIREAANTEIVSESGTFLLRPSSCEFNCQTKAMEGDEMNFADQYKPGGGVG